MSYEIYKSIKQLPDGSFDCLCASNNVIPRYYSKYHMTYFNDLLPNLSNKAKRAAFLLDGYLSGDVFYPTSWKKDFNKVYEFIKFVGYNDSYEFSNYIHTNNEGFAKLSIKFADYLDNEKRAIKIKAIVRLGSFGAYVEKKTKSRIYYCYNRTSAKVFHDTEENIEKLFERCQYKPEIIQI